MAPEIRHERVEATPLAAVRKTSSRGAVLTHWCDYSAMQPAYEALDRWC